MYRVSLVAKHIIKYCNENDIPVSNLKLQKLLYFIQAQFLVSTGSPCFSEKIEAWDFGPVVPEVYYRYKGYGSMNIPYVREGILGLIAPSDKEMIIDIINQCSTYTTPQLVEITHNQDPWVNAYSRYSNNVISKKSIRDYFVETVN